MLENFVFIADVHAHVYKAFSRQVDGMNSRLGEVIRVLEQIRDYCRKNSVPNVIFGGDLFHERGRIQVKTLNAIQKVLRSYVEYGIDITIMAGNHDLVSLHDEESAIRSFQDFATVIESPTVDKGIVYIPYRESKKQILESFDTVFDMLEESGRSFSILVGHFGIDGGIVGDSYVPPGNLTLEEIGGEEWDLILLGHYHKFQQLAENAWYVGSPLAHDFGDLAAEKGFIHVDYSRSDPVKFVPVSSPKFLTHETFTNQIDFDPEDGNYHRLVVRGTKRPVIEGGLVDVVYKPPKKDQEKRSDVTVTSDDEELVLGYMKTQETALDGLSDAQIEEYKKLGTEILREAKL